jgi:hypothetical protein
MGSIHGKLRTFALPALVIALAGCATTNSKGVAYTQASVDEYLALGIERGTIAQREDGMRTSGASGSYEWWYFDSVFSDGSTLVISFETKDIVNPAGPLKPIITFDLTRPDGTKVTRSRQVGPKSFSASRDGCDVKIGDNHISGDLHSYSVHVAIEDVAADLELVGTVPAWRPETGVSVFKKGGEHYFAWLPSVPQGRISGTVTVAGKTEAVAGSGYHDHNWGDVAMTSLIHDWYWGRAQVGAYTVIAAWITASEAYGSDVMPVFMLAKDGKIVADDESKVRFTAGRVHANPKTGKPVADRLVYDYDDGARHYRVTFDRKATIEEFPFTDSMKPFKRFLASLARFDGAYHRFTGSVTVEELSGTQVLDSAVQDSAVWELMYFGHAPKPNPASTK